MHASFSPLAGLESSAASSTLVESLCSSSDILDVRSFDADSVFLVDLRWMRAIDLKDVDATMPSPACSRSKSSLDLYDWKLSCRKR